MTQKNVFNVAWIHGSYNLSSDILRKIKDKYKHAEFYKFDANNSFADIYNTLSSVSCFYSCKLVIVHELPEMTDGEKKKFSELLQNLDKTNLLVFYLVNPAAEKALYTLVEKIGKIYRFDEKISTNDLQEYITKRCKEMGITLEDDALHAFKENLQTVGAGKFVEIDTIENYLQRIVLFEPNKTCYTKNDIYATTTFCQNFIIWNIVNACDKKSYEECLNEFSSCADMSDNSISALSEVLNVLLWRYRMLLSIKEHMANGLSQQVAIEMTTKIRKVSYEGFGYTAKATQQLVQTGANKGAAVSQWNAGVCNQVVNSFYGKKPVIEIYSRRDLYIIVEWLESCLFWSRSCKHQNEAYLIADTIFAIICNQFDKNNVNVLRNSFNKMREAHE